MPATTSAASCCVTASLRCYSISRIFKGEDPCWALQVDMILPIYNIVVECDEYEHVGTKNTKI